MNSAESEFANNSASIDDPDRSLRKDQAEISINLVVRSAITKTREGFGITAYMSATASSAAEADAVLAHAMDILTNALLYGSTPQGSSSTLK